MGFNFNIVNTELGKQLAATHCIDIETKGIDFEQLRKSLQKGVVKVCFKKADETIREMDATLYADLLPETHQESNHPVGETMVVYDLDAEGWRSFRKDRVISVEVYE